MRNIWDLDQNSFNVVFTILLIIFVVCTFTACSSYNSSYITVTDQNVHIVDKYHKAEDCSWVSDGNGGSYESCDPEKFVVIFDNQQSYDLRNVEPWGAAREGQLWHWHKESGRLWTIKEEAYPL
jgi:hypothetical protein